MKNNTVSIDHVQETTEKLIELFENGNLPTMIARSWIRGQQGGRPSDAWSMGNQIIMLIHGTEDARGYRQWEEVGRHVKKGSKAFYILAPMTRKIREKDARGEEQEKVVVTGFRAVPVFRVEDTEGEPLQYPDYTPPALAPMHEIAEAWGYTITYGPGDGHCFGWTNSAQKRIHLMTEEPGTYWHELGHAADARTHEMKGGQQPDQEIVAEMVGATMALLYGQDTERLGYTRHYIEGYAGQLKKSPAAAMMGLLTRVNEALKEIWDTAATVEIAEPVLV